jgi:hypothetical protein
MLRVAFFVMNVIKPSVIMINVVMPSVTMMNVIIQNVVAFCVNDRHGLALSHDTRQVKWHGTVIDI